MSTTPTRNARRFAVTALAAAGALAVTPTAPAKQNIKEAFFNVYPAALGTAIESVPSYANHCGMCHYNFSGGGARNPYGLLLEDALPNFPNNQKEEAVMSIELQDPDGDGFSTLVEVTDTVTFDNTPTFPGLTPANVSAVQSVETEDLLPFLVPSTGADFLAPEVEVTTPAEGVVLVANDATLIEWTATDAGGVAGIDLYLSLDDGVTYTPLALGLSNTGSYIWQPANRPTGTAVVLVAAIDNAFNIGDDESGDFEIASPPGGIVPTTLRDFDQPGSQPFEAGILNPPEACVACHGGYDEAVEPYFNWRGSPMSLASRDLLFEANMAIANQDAPESGDLCIRCHMPRGWLQGRSTPTDGSRLLLEDMSGVSCDFCHRLVDPFFDPAANPAEDEAILADLSFPASDFGNGMATIDPTGARRGPFLDAATGHPVLVSPFHREAALCGTCHDVSNPAFDTDGAGNYVPNAWDSAATSFSAHTLGPVERTYSEWFYSAYNTPEGVFAPQFGGNLDYVGSCQDCHMRDVTGQGASFGSPPVRDDLPLHDMTGGSTWLPPLLATLYPDDYDAVAVQAGVERARYMLQNAATLEAEQVDDQLIVTVTNETGHKLPTGYPEGRRMWIGVRFLDGDDMLISESGEWDPLTGILADDPELTVYEVKPGVDETVAPLLGVDPGPSFHFVLNNKIFKDNRIPPRGFTNAAYGQFGGAPVGHVYADGQYWDDTPYAVPSGAVTAEVTLYYQSTSKEFVEFLRDENTTNTKGDEMFALWDAHGKCPPETMASVMIEIAPPCDADVDGSGVVDVDDLVQVIVDWGPCPPTGDCADVNGDGVVNVNDLVAIITDWGPC